MQKKTIRDLLNKYQDGVCTEEEKSLIENWYLQFENKDLQDLSEFDRSHDLDEIWQTLPIHHLPRRIFPWSRILAAAAILLFFSFGLYFFFNKHVTQTHNSEQVYKNDIVPGKNKAFLTLANGTRISLDDAANGEIAKQAGIIITKTEDGQLVYTVANSAAQKENVLPGYNTIETPKGGQYQVNLPDGSKVWLNAASSLRYPALFNGNHRKVELTGEAYFEIAVDKKKPFIVHTAIQEVEVLGTHFNINSYSDEPATKTTLIEGSVKVSQLGTSNSRLLIPGQQAVLAKNIQVVSVDTEEALAWKNGYFMFNDESLESIMRKISRWYDVEIEYQNYQINQEAFAGTVSRSGNVSKVLKMLEITGDVRFEIVPGDASGNGGKIIVTSESKK